MAGMTKLILLMTLVAVSFLPQDGMGARAKNFKCHSKGGGGGETTVECSSPHLCFRQTKRGVNTKGCTGEREESDPSFNDRSTDGCRKLLAEVELTTNEIGEFCVCSKDLCNGPPAPSVSDRLHGHSLSVLSVLCLCVVSIFFAVSFFGKH